jgi:hypothetical protein
VTYSNCDSYHGHFSASGQKSGEGTYTASNGDEYVGHFSNDLKDGHGTYRSANGDVFVGTYHAGNRTTGTYTAANGDIYEGEYLNEYKEDTSGVYTTTSGSRYEGGFHMDYWEGLATFTWANGAVMTSGWCGGAPHGDGVVILGSKALLLHDGQRTSTTTVSDANQVASSVTAPSCPPAPPGGGGAKWDETRDNPFSQSNQMQSGKHPRGT